MKKHASIKFALTGIQTIEFAVIKELFNENKPVDITFTASFGINSFEERNVMCCPEVCFVQQNIPFIKIKTACFFETDSDTWEDYIDKENNIITFPKGFTDHLLVISVGTLRGTLHAKTEGTEFNRFFLPTINVSESYTDDVKISLD